MVLLFVFQKLVLTLTQVLTAEATESVPNHK